MCFSWKNIIYSFQVLPFGLASAPRVFTKVMKPVYATFRQNGIRCCYYIDDSLIMNQNEAKCKQEISLIVNELDSLGFAINETKSVFAPTQRLEFFGVIIDTVLFKVFLTEEKLVKLKTLSRKVLDSPSVTIREFSSLVGIYVHAFNAVLLGPLHYRSLERDKILNLKLNSNNFDSVMVPSLVSRKDIVWWLENIDNMNGKSIKLKPVDVWIESDASNEGWGAHLNGCYAGGRWSCQESTFHINYLELLAMFLALKSFFANGASNLHIGIKSDNQSAISYINNMGGMASLDMDLLSVKIWNWCIEHNFLISAQYLPGSMNLDADFMSRKFSDSCEWSLKNDIFERICNHFFIPDIDLFASRINHKIIPFVSWLFDPEAFLTDAFSFSWSGFQPYIFPPFCLISRVLNKLEEDKVEQAILIVPFWPTQTWFSLLISALISIPARLPRHKDLLTLPHSGVVHPMKKMSMIACCVSGLSSRREEFLNKMPLSSQRHGDLRLLNSINYAGKDGFFGAVNGRSIGLNPLKGM